MAQIGLETWRGSVRPWHIDEMGHMNVRYYLAIAAEAMAGMAGAMGMPRAFMAGASATLLAREHHVRFLREARVRARLHMECAVLEMGETEARVLQVLFHSDTGEPAAAIVTRVEHITPREMRPFPFSTAARRLAEGLMAPTPDYAKPRGLAGEPRLGPPSLAKAVALGLHTAAAGALMPADADVFGAMRPDHVLERISQAMPQQFDRARLQVRQHMPQMAGHLGGATVELRQIHHRSARIGDRLELRAGLSDVTAKVNRLTHWLLDPATGEPWTETEMLTVNFDLETRKAVELPPEMVKILAADLIAPKP